MLIKSINPAVSCEYNNIRQIIIYGHGEKLYTATNGYFQESRISKGKISDVYDGRPAAVTLATEPKRARKENLNRNDNYFLTYRGEYSWEAGIVLYIHESEISVTPAGEYVAFDTHGETNYKNAVKLHFVHGATMRRCKLERVPEAGKDFTPPDGCKWSKDYSRNPEKPNYDVIYPRPWADQPGPAEVVKRWIENEIVFDIIAECAGYSRTEKTPERLHREKLAKMMNDAGLFRSSVSHYDIETLEKLFDITIKREV